MILRCVGVSTGMEILTSQTTVVHLQVVLAVFFDDENVVVGIIILITAVLFVGLHAKDVVDFFVNFLHALRVEREMLVPNTEAIRNIPVFHKHIFKHVKISGDELRLAISCISQRISRRNRGSKALFIDLLYPQRPSESSKSGQDSRTSVLDPVPHDVVHRLLQPRFIRPPSVLRCSGLLSGHSAAISSGPSHSRGGLHACHPYRA